MWAQTAFDPLCILSNERTRALFSSRWAFYVPQIMWETDLLFLPSSGGGDVCVGREKECSKPKGARVMKRKESYSSDRRG